VVGVPRSGTTLIGSFLGTSGAVLDLGEYGGPYLAFGVGPQLSVAARLAGDAVSPYVARYHREIQQHAVEFPSTLVDGGEIGYWCDSSPANLMVVEALKAHLPDALWVLVIRDHRGVLPSLARCFARGEWWAGSTWRERAHLWTKSYRNAASLPRERTVAVSYDMLCRSPEQALGTLRRDLALLGFPTESLDDAALATSWATPADDNRPTIARLGDDGMVHLCAMERPNPPPWSDDEGAVIRNIVEPACQILRHLFPHLAEYI
jgi:hypothetical protein